MSIHNRKKHNLKILVFIIYVLIGRLHDKLFRKKPENQGKYIINVFICLKINDFDLNSYADLATGGFSLLYWLNLITVTFSFIFYN